MLILHDPRDVLATEFGAGVRRAPRAHPKYFAAGDSAYVGWFLSMFRQIYTWTKRGAQRGERGFDKLAAAADSLRRVRASLVEMRSDRHESEPWLRGRRIPRLCEAGHVYGHRYCQRRGRGYYK